MIPVNRQLTTFRLQKSGSKESFSNDAILNGVGVYLSRPSFDKASFIDQDNALEVYQIDSDTVLDLKKGDKCVDEYGDTYIVHSVYHEKGHMDAGNGTFAYLRKKNV